ncbi:MAG: ABC transporter permease [Alkalispirochaetaceae bacterium]
MGRHHAIAAAAVVVALLVAFFLLPLLAFYGITLQGEGLPALGEAASRALASGRLARIAGFTFSQAAISAAISLLVALPGAYLLSHYDFPFRRISYSFTLLPFVLPSIIVVIAMISFFGRGGLLNQLFGTRVSYVYSYAGIVLAHVFYNFSLAIRVLSAGWQSIDRRYQEIASSLGDTAFGRFRRITLPLLTPSILTAFLLVFIYCFLSFGVVLVFGGVQYETFEVRIYSDINVRLDFVSAALYGAVQLFFTGGIFLLSGRLIRGGSAVQAEMATPERRLSRATLPVRLSAAAYAAFLAFFLLGPVLTLIYRSFLSDGRLSFHAYAALFGGETERNVESILRATIPEVMAQSILLAVASGTLSFIIAMTLAWVLRGDSTPRGSLLSTLAQLPLGISLVTVALGVRLLYIPYLPLPLLVVVTQAIATLPLVYRIVSTETRRLRESYVEGARSLGAGTVRILREIVLPVLRRGLLNAYAYALALPFADLTAVLTVGRGEIATFPVAIYRLIGFRSFDLALALSGIYLLICFLLFYWIDRTSFRRRSAGALRWSG